MLKDINNWLTEPGTPAELDEAMRYCLEGGKGLRPKIVYLSAAATGGDEKSEPVRAAAVSVELVHVYSLVHDDLPDMDNDDTRRGKPTVHVKYSPAMAILVGDALLTRAAGILAEHGGEHSTALVAELASGAGAAGMVAGQVADLGLCTLPDGLDGVEYIHMRKTAALFRTAARMGATASGAPSEQIDAVGNFARNIGMAFQVFDDVLDADEIARGGNQPGSCLLYLDPEEARRRGRQLTDRAIEYLAPLGDKALPLRELAQSLVSRTR